jgi:uncharacterized protein (TIGR02466 family)
MQPKMVNMFAVPFAFSRCPEHAPLNAALKGHLLALEKTGKAANPHPLTQRNAALFESHFNLFRDPHPAIQQLKVFCWDQLLAVIGRLNGYDLAALHRLQIFNDCWFHVMRRGGFFGVHNHPNASWSGVYCVDTGRGDAGSKDGGLLSFINPHITSAMHLDAGIANMPLPYGNQVASVALEPGELVIFPSWVLHDVKPYDGDGERVTVAFNCWFTLPDPPAADSAAAKS